jgi:hypothetical protein
MMKVNKIEDIYPAIDELIKVLAQNNKQRLSNILHHRMYKVSWTSRDELFEELSNVLKSMLKNEKHELDPSVIEQIAGIHRLIDEVLAG